MREANKSNKHTGHNSPGMGKTQHSHRGHVSRETPPPSPRSVQARAPKQLWTRGILIISFVFVMLKASAWQQEERGDSRI